MRREGRKEEQAMCMPEADDDDMREAVWWWEVGGCVYYIMEKMTDMTLKPACRKIIVEGRHAFLTCVKMRGIYWQWGIINNILDIPDLPGDIPVRVENEPGVTLYGSDSITHLIIDYY